MDYFIGIDIGTSSVKCLALGPSGESIAVSRKAYPVIEDSSAVTRRIRNWFAVRP
jgi:sugar (pentulose or hexulose) kinase